MARSNIGLKKARAVTEYTPEQLVEMRRFRRDPIAFIKKYCIIQHPLKGEIPFALHPYQERMINAYADNRLCIALSPRQSGKSWGCGAFFLWYSIFRRGKTLLIASNKNSNAMEMIARVQFMYERLPDWIKPGVVEYSKHHITFDNGTRILSQATTEDTGRGLSVSKLFLDEFAFVPKGIQDELWASLSPTLSTGGSLIICSTPNGDVDMFSQLWRGATTPANGTDGVGINGFQPIDVKWNEVPGRDEKFKEAEIAKIGEVRFRQEYECEFISSDPLLIDTTVLQNLTTHTASVKPVGTVQEVTLFEHPVAGATYLAAMDPATGSGEDFSTIQVFRFPEMVQAAEFRSNTASPAVAYFNLKKILRLYEQNGCTVYYTVENNGIGEAILTLMEVDEDPLMNAEFVTESGSNRGGMTTTKTNKLRSCVALKDMIERGQMVINSAALVTELKYFVRTSGTYRAQIGAHDDLVMATTLVVRLLTEIASFEQDAYDKLYTSDYTEEDYSDWDGYDPSHFMAM